jgi:hypothetical protein
MSMTPKQRLVAAFERRPVDRLPVTTHHVMPYFLDKYMGGISNAEFFAAFGLDPIVWINPHCPAVTAGEYFDPRQDAPGFLEARRIWSDQWQVRAEELPHPEYKTVRYSFVTPGGTLSMVLQSNSYTSWVVEYLVKDKRDIDLIGAYATAPRCDVAAVNAAVADVGARAIVRSHIACFDVFGQPGTWQDACCLFPLEQMILMTYDDPQWVHEFLHILQARKKVYVTSMAGAQYDIVELGGGAASSTVISPKLFEQFVAPYDCELIDLAHRSGQRIAYHTCGGMMPILEQIAAMRPDAMETFTPKGMGGDVDLGAAKARIGDRVCMIGGFDQFHFLTGCTEAQTRAEVRRCFEAAGEGGGYVLCPSDHFFDADLRLLHAFADEARGCVY